MTPNEAKAILSTRSPEELKRMDDIMGSAFVLYVEHTENLTRDAAMLRVAELCTALDMYLEDKENDANGKPLDA